MTKTTMSLLLVGFLAASCDALNGSSGNAGPAGPQGPQGPKGDTGPQGPSGNNVDGGTSSASISSLVPATIPGARTAMLELSAVNSHFNSTTTVTFVDTNIVVNKVDVGSPTNLRVQLTLNMQATFGAHDVTVTTPGVLSGQDEKLVLQGGLTVQPTLAADFPAGVTTPPAVVEGGLATVLFRNLDYSRNLFDPLTVHPSYGIGSLYGLTMPPMNVMIDSATFSTLVLVDALAPVGGLSAGLASRTPISTTVQFISDPADVKAPQVTTRMAVPLSAGAGLNNQKIIANNTTVLYTITTPADNYVATVNLSTLGSGLTGSIFTLPPRVLGALAPSTGHFADGLPFDTSNTITGTTLTARNVALYFPKAGMQFFALYTDNLSGSANHSYVITPKYAVGNLLSLKEPATPDTPTTPLVSMTISKPYYATDGAIDIAGDADYIKIQPNANGSIYASVSAPAGAQIGVGLFTDVNCTTPLGNSMLRVGQGASSQEESVSMGTIYCVKITGPAPTPYQLVLTQDLP